MRMLSMPQAQDSTDRIQSPKLCCFTKPLTRTYTHCQMVRDPSWSTKRRAGPSAWLHSILEGYIALHWAGPNHVASEQIHFRGHVSQSLKSRLQKASGMCSYPSYDQLQTRRNIWWKVAAGKVRLGQLESRMSSACREIELDGNWNLQTFHCQ